MSTAATESGLIEMEADLRVCFWTQDIAADAVAKTWVAHTDYQAYLDDLARFEQGVLRYR